jgi:hypothetical protein
VAKFAVFLHAALAPRLPLLRVRTTKQGTEATMNALSCVLVLLIALAALAAGAEAGVLHTGKGTVLSVDARAGRLVMAHEAEGRHAYRLDATTRIIDETGRPITAAEIRVGDYVREECVPEAHGIALAKQIRVLRPAWMESASPEM